MAVASTFTLMGGIFQAVSSIAEGEAGANALRNQADAATDSARISLAAGERNAMMAELSGKTDAAESARGSKRQLARMTAAQGASGAAMSGTVLDMQADQILEANYRQGKILAASSNKAEGYRTQGEMNSYSSLLQAQSLNQQADASSRRGLFGGGSSILGSLAQGAQLGGGFFG